MDLNTKVEVSNVNGSIWPVQPANPNATLNMEQHVRLLRREVAWRSAIFILNYNWFNIANYG